MNITYRRLAQVSLSEAITPIAGDRDAMGISTLIDGPDWLVEAAWDGHALGDIQAYRNENCREGHRKVDANDVPLPDKWVWWAGVPFNKVRCYRFVAEDVAAQAPMTAAPPFDGKREAKPGSAAAKHAPAA